MWILGITYDCSLLYDRMLSLYYVNVMSRYDRTSTATYITLVWYYYISSSVRSAHEALELHLTLVYYEFTSACPARSESRRMCGRLKWLSKFTFFLVTCTFMIDQVWSILPALEFLLLDCSHCRQKGVFCLRLEGEQLQCRQNGSNLIYIYDIILLIIIWKLQSRS